MGLVALQQTPEKIGKAQPIYDSSHYRVESSTSIDQVSRKEATHRSFISELC
jgi:hypothetical protein